MLAISSLCKDLDLFSPCRVQKPHCYKNITRLHSIYCLHYRGDEASIASDEVKKEEKPGIPDDFFYEYDDVVSKPRITGKRL